MSHQKTLIGLIVFFLIFWIGLPRLFPGTARPIYAITMPVRHLGIFVHEMGHGLSTLLSGGRFHWFQMKLMEGGVAVTSGGLHLLTLLGGLLGPAFLGALLLFASTRAKNVEPVLWGLAVFFLAGIYYMIKPLFLSAQKNPLVAQWSPVYLISLLIPAFMVWLALKLLGHTGDTQRFALQVIGVLMCYSGYSDTSYIFHYERLANGLYSDARELAAIFWPSVETVPFWLFAVTATLVSILNFGLMFLGVYGALRRS